MTDRAECRGAGEGVASRHNGGGRYDRRGRCSICGKDLKLTPSGRIPRHVPARQPKTTSLGELLP